MNDLTKQPDGTQDGSLALPSEDDRTGIGDNPQGLESAPEQIGRYRIRERIGGGGMGEVFAADQSAPIKRRVAIKIIKAGMDSKQVVARFDAERQALAMMDHPNIARVLDAGTTEHGRPYFVMELVRGVPITQFCDQNRLSTRQRLELLIPVCMAVQHAHQKGIIHRDLKPSNVLVTLHDGVPVPKVIDFGIAKATNQQLTNHTVYTEVRAMIGTPAYMSPEQAEMSGLDIDTRSDVYSLGVMMYELITGSTPFEPERLMKAGLVEVQKIISEEEPPRPSQRLSTLGEAITSVASRRNTEPARLGKIVAGELDWIIMKALEKDRRRRYGSASEFAADLQRYLDGEPVIAAPPSTAYRLQKFARRNRTALVTSSLVLIVLVAGVVASGWMAIRARKAEREVAQQLVATQREEAVAKAERDEAQKARQRADASEAMAREQATKSSLLANYTLAKYMLSEGRTAPAYEAITAAIRVKPNCEYGILLERIVSESRECWSLVGEVPESVSAIGSDATEGADATLGALVGKNRCTLALCAGSQLRLYDVARARVVAEVDLGFKPRFLVPVGDRAMAVANATTARICSLPDPGEQRVVPLAIDRQEPSTRGGHRGLIRLASDDSGAVLCVLVEDGTAIVIDTATMKEVARHRFNVLSERPGLPQEANDMRFSPAGELLSFTNGTNSRLATFWSWRQNREFQVNINFASTVRLIGEQSAVAFRRSDASANHYSMAMFDLRSPDSAATFYGFPSRASSNASAWVARGPSGKERVYAAATSSDSIDLFSVSEGRMLSSSRFSSLLPRARGRLRFLSFSPVSGLLALAESGRVFVFQAVVEGARPVSPHEPLPMAFWSNGSSRDFVFVVNGPKRVSGSAVRPDNTGFADEVTLIRKSYLDGTSKTERCQWPAAPANRVAYPWGLAVTPDARWVALLWQETTEGGVDSEYFRKAIVVYDRDAPRDEQGRLVVAHTIWLDAHEGVNGRNNRLINLSPDAGTVAFFQASGSLTFYRVSDGQVLSDVKAGRTVAKSPDGSLMATGEFAADAPIQVWDAGTGRLLRSTTVLGTVRTLAITPDNLRVYAGWTGNVLECFDTRTGASVSRVKSPIAPSAISPTGDRFIGFLPDSETYGSSVLGSLPDGETIHVLNEGSHVLSRCFFSGKGDGISYPIHRQYAQMWWSMTIAQADAALAEPRPLESIDQLVPEKQAALFSNRE